jgi:gliding motility-associated-like protein
MREPRMKIVRSKYFFILLLSQVIVLRAFGITANFTFTKTSNCSPSIVMFTNNSTKGTGIIYTWDFGQGAIVTTTESSAREQVYTKSGQYLVKLRVTDGTSTDSTSSVINIFRGPAAGFSADRVNGCPPLNVTLTSTSTAGESDLANTSWDFRNGENKEGKVVQYLYNATGTFGIVLKVTDRNGCSSILESERAVIVTERPKADFAASDTFACAPPLNVTFSNLSKGSSILSYKWDLGNGDTSSDIGSSSVYATPGSYSVKLKAVDSYGCADSLLKNQYIKIGYPKGSLKVFDGNDSLVKRSFLCSGLYRFVYSDAGLPDYSWKITENGITTTLSGRNTITYRVSGTGNIEVKVVYGKKAFCTDSISVSFAKSYIKAAFNLNDTIFCSVPSQVTLANLSQNADMISWYISDRLISNEKTASYTITENDLPEETYSQRYSHEVNAFKLPFKLVVSNGGVCFDSVINIVSIAKPVARFMPDKVSGCVPLQVSFSDSSKSVFKIDSRVYKIGNDSVVSIFNSPSLYTITKPGEYYVTEIIRSGVCADTSEVVRIVAGDKLVPDFTVLPGEVCNGGEIKLSGSVANNSLPGLWRFRSDGIFDFNLKSKPDTIISIYSDTNGFKNITLQTDYNGCLSETTKINILNIKGPAGDFSQSFSCDSSLSYRFKSVISPATSMVWNIDTATVNDLDSVDYRFPAGGNYTVKLAASDLSSNCTLTRTKIINVRQVLAGFTMSDTILCAGDTLHLDGTSSRDYISHCFNEGFLWDFGDDTPPRRSFLKGYDHIYSTKGIDTVRLFVTGDNGCTDSTKKVVKVFSPSGSFTVDKDLGCVPEMSVDFRNTSTDSTIILWVWDFGDKSSDSTNTPNLSHSYSSESQQTFYPTLTVYDAHQCYSGSSVAVELLQVDGNFQADDKAICAGQTVTFTPAESGLTSMLWDYGDGASGIENTHNYAKAGAFNVSLTATKAGCSKTVAKSEYIVAEKANASFLASDTILFCYPDTISFIHNNSLDSPAVDYLWTFGSQSLTDQSSNSVKYTFTKPGKYTASLSVRTLNGCPAKSSKNILISGPKAVVSFSPDKICYNESVTFSIDSLKDVNSWKLLFGDGSTSTENPVSHRYTSRGKIVPVIQLNNAGCNAILTLDTLSVSKVQALFNAPDTSLYVCYGNKLSLLNNSIGTNSWSWAIDNVQKSTSFNLNDILLSKTGDYNIRLVARETGGCVDTLIKKYMVVERPAFSISGDSIVCSGKSSVALSVNKNPGWTIRWTPPTGISDPASFSVTASPSDSTTYTAVVKDSYGCTSSRNKKIMVNQPFDLKRSPLSDTTINIGDRVQLVVSTSSPGVSYSWLSGSNISCTDCSNPWVSPAATTTYTVKTKNSCFDFVESFLVEVIRDFFLEAPSAFTPNGDSNNDLFLFEEKNIKNFELKIYNRWGEKVFSTNDLHEGWDGNVNGHPQNIDTYKYALKAETIHGYKFEKKGEFLLIK